MFWCESDPEGAGASGETLALRGENLTPGGAGQLAGSKPVVRVGFVGMSHMCVPPTFWIYESNTQPKRYFPPVHLATGVFGKHSI